MVSQEERQRSVGAETISGQDLSGSVTMSVKDDQRKFNNMKDPSVSAHYKIVGQTIDKCYKLHGYPPGYKPKFKSQANVPEGVGNHNDQMLQMMLSPPVDSHVVKLPHNQQWTKCFK